MTVALATPVLFLLHLFASVPQATQMPSFVAERSPSYSFKDGIHELGSGRGWLRTTGVYLNFRAAFDFKTMTPDSDAGVLFRTWTGTDEWPGRGYRFRLPSESAASPSSLVVGHRAKVTIVQDGRIDLQPSGEWQQVEIVGDGRRITLTLNRTLVGVFEVERYGGHILFDNRKGRVQLRNIEVVSTETDPQTPANVLTAAQLKKAGGEQPTLLHEVRPTYTPEAMKKGVEGRVFMEVVVLTDGSPGAIRVTRSLDSELDTSAIAAVRAWKFKPTVLKGEAVPVLVEVEMTFRLK